MDQVVFSVKNDLSQLSLIVEKLEEISNYWNLGDDVLFNINLAIEEIFTNIVFYAYDDKEEHEIVFRISRQNNRVIIDVEDDGKEFNPLDNPEPEHIDKPLEEREIGGLGIHFVKTIMNDVRYKRDGNKNILTLTIKTNN